ncbi:unnamed protein product, partial [Darwinula stevensoni]
MDLQWTCNGPAMDLQWTCLPALRRHTRKPRRLRGGNGVTVDPISIKPREGQNWRKMREMDSRDCDYAGTVDAGRSGCRDVGMHATSPFPLPAFLPRFFVSSVRPSPPLRFLSFPSDIIFAHTRRGRFRAVVVRADRLDIQRIQGCQKGRHRLLFMETPDPIRQAPAASRSACLCACSIRGLVLRRLPRRQQNDRREISSGKCRLLTRRRGREVAAFGSIGNRVALRDGGTVTWHVFGIGVFCPVSWKSSLDSSMVIEGSSSKLGEVWGGGKDVPCDCLDPPPPEFNLPPPPVPPWLSEESPTVCDSSCHEIVAPDRAEADTHSAGDPLPITLIVISSVVLLVIVFGVALLCR